ncbi:MULTISPECIES: GAF and ANTAR domain-containing protein [Actinoplanes]|uniref:ANTAR domain-containing protein n=2 Tax=Actinoplanes TaxID=1865 RepID=A0A101JT58_9ACTN|nr:MULTISPECIES: GAF and ANTAR domain-containing protein [Actinoplanes]KUL32609.1 hypothetical protein ADL15_18990 [Actinoplanes awajinensis subsp. mycoplanecinus]GIE70109.1 transcriptional regulator [Actinoplanes palleronii]
MTSPDGSGRDLAPADRVGRVLVTLADTLGDDFDLPAYLQQLTQHCRDLLGVDGAGVLLADTVGTLRIAALSGADVRRLEQAGLTGGDGPSVIAFRTGEPVADARLDPVEARWQSLADPARAAGYRRAHAVPMRRGDQVIGALSLFSRSARPLQPPGQRLARALADLATISLLQHRALTTQRLYAAQLQQAFTTRVVIEQAKGVLAERHDIPMDVAFTRLRQQARNSNRRLADLAREILGAAADDPPDGTGPAQA